MGICQCSSSVGQNWYENMKFNNNQITPKLNPGKIFNKYLNKTIEEQNHTGLLSQTIMSVLRSEKDFSLLCDNRYFIRETSRKKIENKEQLAEFKILQHLHHPNILKFYEQYENEKQVYTVQEVPSGKCLKDFIEENSLISDIKAIFDIVRQLLLILQQMKENSIVHRNIHPEVIWFNQEICKVQITDMESATKIYYPSKEQVTSNLMFTAPELIEFHKSQSYQVDIWSVGIIFFTLIQGHGPYKIGVKDDIKQIKGKILNGEIIEKKDCARMVDPEIREYMNYFLNTDPNLRKDDQFLLNHPIMKKYSDRKCDFENQSHILLESVKIEMDDLFANIIGSHLKLHNDKEMNYLYNSIDDNKDGEIDKNEQIDLLKKASPDINHTLITEKVFTQVDKKFGKLDFRDFKMVNFKLNQEGNYTVEVWKFIESCKTLELDEDSNVNFDEFVNTIKIDSCYVLKKLIQSRDYISYYDPIYNTINMKEFIKSLARRTEFYHKFFININKKDNFPSKTKIQRIYNLMRLRQIKFIEFKKSIVNEDDLDKMQDKANNSQFKKDSILEGSNAGSIFNKSNVALSLKYSDHENSVKLSTQSQKNVQESKELGNNIYKKNNTLLDVGLIINSQNGDHNSSSINKNNDKAQNVVDDFHLDDNEEETEVC